MKRFSVGDRVFVRTGLTGADRCATVSADFDGKAAAVLVVIDGKTKAKPFAPARVRLQPDMRVPLKVAAPAPRAAIAPPPPDAPLVSRADGLYRGDMREATFLRAVPKHALPTRDARYLAFVREHRCCACGARENIEAHHWAWNGKGIGTKPDDHRTVPLCQRCHDTFHATGKLRSWTHAGTRTFFLMKQLELLIEWIGVISAPKRSRKERRA